MDENSIIIGSFMGQQVGIGILISVLTQIIKVTEKIPGLSNFKPVRWLLDKIASGNKDEIHLFVAIIAVLTSAVLTYMETGEIASLQTLTGSFATFLSALGTYNIMFDKKA